MRWIVLRTGLAVLTVLAGACVGTEDPAPLATPATSPPPPIPDFPAGPPELDECFPDIQGIPPFTPIPPNVLLDGPDLYAAPYEPVGVPPKRVSGPGFSYEVSSRVGLVAGFYATCLDTYATETDHPQLPTENGDVIFRIELQNRPPVVVVIADDPAGGPTLVVVFTDPSIRPAPSPTPSPTTPTPSPGPPG